MIQPGWENLLESLGSVNTNPSLATFRSIRENMCWASLERPVSVHAMCVESLGAAAISGVARARVNCNAGAGDDTHPPLTSSEKILKDAGRLSSAPKANYNTDRLLSDCAWGFNFRISRNTTAARRPILGLNTSCLSFLLNWVERKYITNPNTLKTASTSRDSL
jgi:hypothetical protein